MKVKFLLLIFLGIASFKSEGSLPRVSSWFGLQLNGHIGNHRADPLGFENRSNLIQGGPGFNLTLTFRRLRVEAMVQDFGLKRGHFKGIYADCITGSDLQSYLGKSAYFRTGLELGWTVMTWRRGFSLEGVGAYVYSYSKKIISPSEILTFTLIKDVQKVNALNMGFRLSLATSPRTLIYCQPSYSLYSRGSVTGFASYMSNDSKSELTDPNLHTLSVRIGINIKLN